MEYSIVMMGASGAVGGQVVERLLSSSLCKKLSLLGRRIDSDLQDVRISQHVIDIFDPLSYGNLITEHEVAICTLGVGQPSKISKEEFINIDKKAVLKFATTSKKSGVSHFLLLSSVAANSSSKSFYLRTKGELEDGLRELQFEQLSLFHPSMILTPNNRYGISQAITLKVWPWLSPLLLGSLKKYRGIRVEDLGAAIAERALYQGSGAEVLEWTDFQELKTS